MMAWWKRKKAEDRAVSPADAYVNKTLAQSYNGFSGLGVSSTAAVESCAGLWQRAFASAVITPSESPATIALTPRFFGQVGRELIFRGESIWLIEVVNGQVGLSAVADFDVSGGVREESWLYRLDLAGPSGTETKSVSSSEVLHFRYSTDARRPYQGVSPLRRAGGTNALANALEKALCQEASSATGFVLPSPMGGTEQDTASVENLTQKLATLEGRTALVPGMSAWGEGQAAAPKSDWTPRRLGANPPATLVALREDCQRGIFAACGVPVEMASSSGGSGAREAWRRLLHGTISPAFEDVLAELRVKLEEPQMAVSFSNLFASDIGSRARSFSQLVKAGLTLEKAAGLSGLIMDEED